MDGRPTIAAACEVVMFWGALAGLMLAVGFRVMNPSVGWGEIILLGVVPILVASM